LYAAISVETPGDTGRIEVVGPVGEQLEPHHVDGTGIFEVHAVGLEFAAARFTKIGGLGQDILGRFTAPFTQATLGRFDPVNAASHFMKNGHERVDALVFFIKTPKIL
jgi:hypothetical protein